MKRQEKISWYKKEFEDISKEIFIKNELSLNDFLRIRNFKLQNSTTEAEINIKKITSEAFALAEKDKIKEAISILIQLGGVRIPIASTILAMKFPEKFAIIDNRVIKSLGKTEWLKDYLTSSEIYEKYLLLIRKQAKLKNLKLRDYERSLFESAKNKL